MHTLQYQHLIPAQKEKRRHPGHNTRPHAWLPPSILSMDAWMTSQLNVAFDSQATLIIDVPGSSLTSYQWVFVQPGADRRVVDWCRNYMSVL